MLTLGSVDHLDAFRSALPDENAAVDYFTARRWRNGEFCPYCGHTKPYHLRSLGRHTCSSCGYRFSIKTNTLFHNSSRPMHQWLAVIWLATRAGNGLTAPAVSDMLNISGSSAWSMLARLRYATRTPSFLRPIDAGLRGHHATPMPAASVSGHHYERKLKIGMPFEEAIDRFADVTPREVDEAKANSPRQKRVQRAGWRGSVRSVDAEPVDADDDVDIEIRSAGLVDDAGLASSSS